MDQRVKTDHIFPGLVEYSSSMYRPWHFLRFTLRRVGEKERQIRCFMKVYFSRNVCIKPIVYQNYRKKGSKR